LMHAIKVADRCHTTSMLLTEIMYSTNDAHLPSPIQIKQKGSII